MAAEDRSRWYRAPRNGGPTWVPDGCASCGSCLRRIAARRPDDGGVNTNFDRVLRAVQNAVRGTHPDRVRCVICRCRITVVLNVQIGVIDTCCVAAGRDDERDESVTFGEIGVLFVLVAPAASYIPARRASKIDPVRVLRVEDYLTRLKSRVSGYRAV